jgi:hypothetical protein
MTQELASKRFQGNPDAAFSPASSTLFNRVNFVKSVWNRHQVVDFDSVVIHIKSTSIVTTLSSQDVDRLKTEYVSIGGGWYIATVEKLETMIRRNKIPPILGFQSDVRKGMDKSLEPCLWYSNHLNDAIDNVLAHGIEKEEEEEEEDAQTTRTHPSRPTRPSLVATLGKKLRPAKTETDEIVESEASTHGTAMTTLRKEHSYRLTPFAYVEQVEYEHGATGERRTYLAFYRFSDLVTFCSGKSSKLHSVCIGGGPCKFFMDIECLIHIQQMQNETEKDAKNKTEPETQLRLFMDASDHLVLHGYSMDPVEKFLDVFETMLQTSTRDVLGSDTVILNGSRPLKTDHFEQCTVHEFKYSIHTVHPEQIVYNRRTAANLAGEIIKSVMEKMTILVQFEQEEHGFMLYEHDLKNLEHLFDKQVYSATTHSIREIGCGKGDVKFGKYVFSIPEKSSHCNPAVSLQNQMETPQLWIGVVARDKVDKDRVDLDSYNLSFIPNKYTDNDRKRLYSETLESASGAPSAPGAPGDMSMSDGSGNGNGEDGSWPRPFQAESFLNKRRRNGGSANSSFCRVKERGERDSTAHDEKMRKSPREAVDQAVQEIERRMLGSRKAVISTEHWNSDGSCLVTFSGAHACYWRKENPHKSQNVYVVVRADGSAWEGCHDHACSSGHLVLMEL